MKVSVNTLIGENGITLEDGQKVYALIHPALLAGQQVELDFADVHVVASPFFNAAIGHLLQDIKLEDLIRLLGVANLVPAGDYVLRRVIENSKEYYSSQDVRKAVDEILRKQVETM
jgi:hypothetical protein